MILFNKNELKEILNNDDALTNRVWAIIVQEETETLEDFTLPLEAILIEIESYCNNYSLKPEKFVVPSSKFIGVSFIANEKNSRYDTGHYLQTSNPHQDTIWWISKTYREDENVFCIASYTDMINYPEFYFFDYKKE